MQHIFFSALMVSRLVRHIELQVGPSADCTLSQSRQTKPSSCGRYSTSHSKSSQRTISPEMASDRHHHQDLR